MTLSLQAFAKINRSLIVRERRPDGYHELETVFQTIDLRDRLTFRPRDDGELRLTGDDPALATGETNLVLQAARALRERFGTRAGADIHLSKTIPVGAGLGGGSADAAVTLLGLSALWKLEAARRDLQGLAADLGSDVAFFLTGGTARGTGRGERIEPLEDAPAEFLVLLVPAFPLSTAAVYGALSGPPLTGDAPDPNLSSPSEGFPDRNDLEAAAEALRPELRTMRDALKVAGATRARLSGSGSAVFGVFPGRREAERGVTRLGALPENTGVRIVATVSRAEYMRCACPASGLSEESWGVDKW